jgi:hypothetical protein
MKACKSLLLFCFLGISISSCFDPPEFSSIPEIDLQKIQFKETPAAGDFDTLVVYLTFKDGDGDLGLDLLDPRFSEEPYNDSYFFVANGDVINGVGQFDTVTTRVVYTTDGTKSFDLLNLPSGVTGKLATDRTRLQPNYGMLPFYDPNSCLDYSLTQILVAEEDNVVDATYNIIDTLSEESDPDSKYFLVEEPFLYSRNPYHNNIEVKFFQFSNGSYVEYDWFEEFCIDFSGRFPNVTNNEDSPVEGTIRYAMSNSSFLAVFGNNLIKLKIKIRDRALNTSKEIETPPFDLRSKI